MNSVPLGVTLPQFTDDPGVLLDAARRAEELGLDSIWVFDHLWPLSGGKHRPVIESWTALAWLAAATTRVKIGTLVTRSSLRHPAVVARMAATVASIAPGRTIVGVGSGDDKSRAENETFGLPFYEHPDRLQQLTDFAEALARAWAEPVVDLDRRFVRLTRLPSEPRPVPRPQLWLAGRSPGVIETAARVADGWNGWGGSATAFAAKVQRLARLAGERMVTPTWGGLAILDADDDAARAKLGRRDPRAYVVGGPERLARHLAALVDAGARHLIVTFPDAGRVGAYERLAGEVRARISSADAAGDARLW